MPETQEVSLKILEKKNSYEQDEGQLNEIHHTYHTQRTEEKIKQRTNK